MEPSPEIARSAPILVPLELSSTAPEILAFAARLATCGKTPLVVLHVVSGADGERYANCIERDIHPSRSISDLAHEQLRALVAAAAEQHPDLESLREIRTVLVDGTPAGRILEVAQQEAASQIVMGSHARRGFSRVLIGSVAESVIRNSTVPVTVVKNGHDEATEAAEALS